MLNFRPKKSDPYGYSQNWKWAFALVAFVLLVGGVTAFLKLRSFANTSELLEVSYRDLNDLKNLGLAVTTAETGQRGFILTDREEYLGPYVAGMEAARNQLISLSRREGLRQLSDEMLQELNLITTQRLNELEATTELFKSGNRQLAIESVHSDEGRQLMDEFRATLVKLERMNRNFINQEIQNVRSSGEVLYFTVALAALLVPVIGVLLLVVNDQFEKRSADLENEINRRLSSEADLQRSENFAQNIIDNSGDCITVLSKDGKILMLNRAGMELMEIGDIDQVWGTPWADLWGEHAGTVREAIARAAKGEQQRFQESCTTLKGRWKWWDVNTFPANFGAGGSERVVAIARDMTDQRLTKEEIEKLLEKERSLRSEAERAIRVKDEFVATLSHELRTPLNAVLGWTQILNRKPADASIREKALEVIESNCKSLSLMVEDLLEMNRLISGKVKLNLQKVELAELTESVLTSILPTAQAKNVTLERAIENVGPVFGDNARLRQVIWNLLSNAVKFTPAGGTIRLALGLLDGKVCIRVSDSGIGIEPEFLPFVFEKFRQADGSPSRTHGGLGLGLSIAKELIELHSGTIRVASGGKGQGSIFTVLLPAAVWARFERADQIPQSSDGESALSSELVSLEGKKLLVVDDEEDAREMLSYFLKEGGATVVTAGSVDEALGKFHENNEDFDLIISDLGMPRRDGFDLIRSIRTLPGSRGQVKAIALSALTRAQDRKAALATGFNQHVAKPVDLVELAQVILNLTQQGPLPPVAEKTAPAA